MLRILHTSDWHLGKTLERQSRQSEQEMVMEEIVEIAEEESCDLVLVAGDVFDTATPPAWAEALFYETVKALSAGGKRAVVVIAGNHDQPERLTAARPLAERMGIFILGLPQDVPQGEGEAFRCTASGSSWLELTWPKEQAVVVALPYPSEARLGEIFSSKIEEEDYAASYAQRVKELSAALSLHFRDDTVNLATSHLYVQGGKSSDSERPIQLGSAPAVPTDYLPSAQYLALGHLHRPQRLPGGRGRYSGSPLAYGFGEANQEKSVAIVEVEAGQQPSVKTVPLSAGRILLVWEESSIAKVREKVEAGEAENAWIRLDLKLEEDASPSEIRSLKELCDSFVQIRLLMPQQEEERQRDRRAGLSVDQLFRRFYMKQKGHEPSGELVKLFLELLEEQDVEVDSI